MVGEQLEVAPMVRDLPVVLIIFNRPETTRRVFNEIKKMRPRKLFVIADGPREHVVNDKVRCKETREIIEHVDWECAVYKNYSEINLGGPKRIPSGLDWVFSMVDRAVILEDDCLPDTSFFRFCQELLEKYRSDERVMMISGTNLEMAEGNLQYSYYFSRYTVVWGWATWRRAWRKFDSEMTKWSELKRENWLINFLQDNEAARYWHEVFDKMYISKKYHWDYLWIYSWWKVNGFTIVPSQNLVSNIGFGEDATNTISSNDSRASLPTKNLEFPIKHPNKNSFQVKQDKLSRFEGFREIYKKQIQKDSISIYKDFWLYNLLSQNKPISKVLQDQGNRNVAIFGTKKIAQWLLADMKMSGINVVTFLANNIDSKQQSDIPINSPDWIIDNENKIDLIILSIEGDHDDAIERRLKDLIIENLIEIYSWKELVRMNMPI